MDGDTVGVTVWAPAGLVTKHATRSVSTQYSHHDAADANVCAGGSCKRMPALATMTFLVVLLSELEVPGAISERHELHKLNFETYKYNGFQLKCLSCF